MARHPRRTIKRMADFPFESSSMRRKDLYSPGQQLHLEGRLRRMLQTLSNSKARRRQARHSWLKQTKATDQHYTRRRCVARFRTSATPSIVSMAVFNTETAVISAFGTNQLRTATYCTKGFQSRQETFLAPFVPSAPNRSATDTRNVTPRANRRRIRANCKIRSFIIHHGVTNSFPSWFKAIARTLADRTALALPEGRCSRSMFDAKHGEICNGHGSDFKDGGHCFGR